MFRLSLGPFSEAGRRVRRQLPAPERGNISNIGLQCLIKRVPAENTGFPSPRKNLLQSIFMNETILVPEDSVR